MQNKHLLDPRSFDDFSIGLDQINQGQPVYLIIDDRNTLAGFLAGYSLAKKIAIHCVILGNTEVKSRMVMGMGITHPLAHLYRLQEGILVPIVDKRKSSPTLFIPQPKINAVYLSGYLGYDEYSSHDQASYLAFSQGISQAGYTISNPHVFGLEKDLAANLFSGVRENHLWPQLLTALKIGFCTHPVRPKPNLIEDLGSAVGFTIDINELDMSSIGMVAHASKSCTGYGIEAGWETAIGGFSLHLVSRDASDHDYSEIAFLTYQFQRQMALKRFDRLSDDAIGIALDYLKNH